MKRLRSSRLASLDYSGRRGWKPLPKASVVPSAAVTTVDLPRMASRLSVNAPPLTTTAPFIVDLGVKDQICRPPELRQAAVGCRARGVMRQGGVALTEWPTSNVQGVDLSRRPSRRALNSTPATPMSPNRSCRNRYPGGCPEVPPFKLTVWWNWLPADPGPSD